MTEKQKKFVAEYLRDSDGAAAARRAGYKDNSAGRVAARLLREPEIRDKLKTVLEVCAGVKPEEVLRELREVAFAEGSDESGARVKLASKLRALELLGKYLGLFEGGAGKTEKEPVRIVEIGEES